MQITLERGPNTNISWFLSLIPMENPNSQYLTSFEWDSKSQIQPFNHYNSWISHMSYPGKHPTIQTLYCSARLAPNCVNHRDIAAFSQVLSAAALPLTIRSRAWLTSISSRTKGEMNRPLPVRCFRREANCQFCWQIKWERSDSIKERRWQISKLPNCAQQIMRYLMKRALLKAPRRCY